MIYIFGDCILILFYIFALFIFQWKKFDVDIFPILKTLQIGDKYRD